MSRRHKEKETEINYKPQQAESHADGSQKNSRWTISSTSILNKVLTVTKRDRSSTRFFAESLSFLGSVISDALINKKIVVDDKWVKIPRSCFEEASQKMQIDDDVLDQATHSRGRRFLNRLINTVADSKIVGYVKESYQAVKEKCVELYENATQFAACCLKALFRTFAPDDDPYGKLSHYHSLIEHELPGLKCRKQLSNYYRWFVNWKPAVTYESPKAKKERFKHKLWEKLIDWLIDFLQKLAPQYAYAHT